MYLKEAAMPEESEIERKLYAQKRKIETDRFDEGMRIGHDPREDGDYDLEWVCSQKSVVFSKEWEKSQCRTCHKAKDCGYKVAQCCPYYWPV